MRLFSQGGVSFLLRVQCVAQGPFWTETSDSNLTQQESRAAADFCVDVKLNLTESVQNLLCSCIP